MENNINTIEDANNSYQDLDEEIIFSIQQVQSLIDKVIREELVLNVGTLLGEGTGFEENNVTTLIAEINNLANMMDTREDSKYEVEGINDGIFGLYMLGVEVPDFSRVIDTTALGAATKTISIKGRIQSNSQNSLSLVLSKLADFRTSYYITSSSLDNAYATFNIEYIGINNLINDIVVSASGLSNETYANEILQRLPNVVTALGYLAQVYTFMMVNFQEDPLNYNLDNIKTLLLSSNTTLQAQIDDLKTVANLTEFPEINQIEVRAVTILPGIMSNNINQIEELQEGFLELVSQQNIIINDVRATTLELLNAALEIVQAENEVYTGQIDAVIVDLRTRSQFLTTTVLTILNIFVFISLAYIFMTITTGISRIITKNEKFAAGELTVRLREKYGNNEMGRLEESLDNAIREMRAIITSVTQTSETLAGISEELAAGAEEASASITEVSSTVREFSAGSSEQSIMLNRVREELINHLDIIERTANQIDDTASFVLQVAKRTNILGLNASIEAAKAGRFGLGFDVVAEEVRSLSDGTRESAKQIASSIDEIEFNIRQTVQDILNEVNIIREVAENTAAGSEEASAATSEQVSMMTEITQTSTQLSDLSQTLNSLLHRFTI